MTANADMKCSMELQWTNSRILAMPVEISLKIMLQSYATVGSPLNYSSDTF